jgi:hypothetical protein
VRATEVKEALRRRHGADGGSGEWVCIEEAFSGWSSGGRGIDLLAIGAWQTAKAPGLPGAGRSHLRYVTGEGLDRSTDARYPIVAYEVKVSRADFRRELYGYEPGEGVRRWRSRPVPPWPGKARLALERSHYFMFATPAGLLTDDELALRERPEDGKGLWLPAEAGLVEVDGRGCAVRVPAPRRVPRPLTVAEVANLIRHAVNPNQQRALAAECGRLRGEVEYLRRALARERGEAVA